MNINKLIKAVKNNDKKAINNLLRKGMDINALSQNGLCALHIAIEIKNISLIEFLLERGADINFNKEGYYTPIEYASLVGNKQVVEYLLRKGSKTKNLHLIMLLQRGTIVLLNY